MLINMNPTRSRIKIFSKFQQITTLLFLSAFSMIIRGYTFGTGNHSFYIPLIDKINNPGLFATDLMFSFKYNNTFFYHIIAFFNKLLNLESIFLIFYIIGSILFVFCIYELCNLIFNNNTISFIAIILLIIAKPSFGGGDGTIGNTFLYTVITMPILLFSISLFLKKNYILSFSIVGLVFLIHPLSAVHIWGLYMIFFIFEFIYTYKFNLVQFIRSNFFKSILVSTILFAIIICPLLFFKLGSDSFSIFNADIAWLNIQRIRSAHHIFPSTWLVTFIGTSPYLLMGLTSLLFLHQNSEDGLNKRIHNNILIFLLGFILFMLLGTIFTEIIPIELIILFQLFRSTSFAMIFMMIYSAYFIYKLYRTHPQNKILLSGLFSGLFCSEPILILIFLPLALTKLPLIKRIKKINMIGILNLTCIFGVILGIVVFINQISKTFPTFTNNINPFSIVTFFACLLLLSVSGTFNYKNNKRYLLSVVPLLSLPLLVLFFNQRTLKQDMSWINIQKWANTHVNENCSIITPTYLSGFRVYSKRAIYGDWKDGTLAFFSHKFSYAWFKRMNELGIYNGNELEKIYNQLTEEKIKIIAKKYQQQYIIVENQKVLSFKKMYANHKYSIYKINKNW